MHTCTYVFADLVNNYSNPYCFSDLIKFGGMLLWEVCSLCWVVSVALEMFIYPLCYKWFQMENDLHAVQI